MTIEICIIGAGPAGLMAAIFAAEAGAQTTVIEANTSPGRKLLLTGAGRCNLTHQAAPRQLVRAFGAKGRFLSYALYQFPPENVRNFFTGLGLRTKLEKDGCVFPVTDCAGDVRDTLVNRARKLGVTFLYGKHVDGITKETDVFVVCAAKERIDADKLIIATGGLSWPKTGCTGDGYRFARQFGHAIVEPRASLVPLVTREIWPRQLAGTAVENIKISTRLNNNKINTTGAIVFTDDGIGGPAILDMSRYLTDYLQAVGTPVVVNLDLLPHFEQAALETQMTERISENPKKKMTNVMAEFVPKRLSAVLCGLAGCSNELEAGRLRKDVRKKLIQMLKTLPLSIMRTRPIAEATVTRGGVSVNEMESKTMESKICPGLFFAGEVLDVDGPCGGYNLQACWSTGALAGSSSARVGCA
ncbi:MAG: NAD(P)/FAD-dependent oxidoreductase [Sedimentisphaerales bacterium]|nr:NAD(P)/FAD-dependent oxidoreductase [Sedimentisphaerales bacterium]